MFVVSFFATRDGSKRGKFILGQIPCRSSHEEILSPERFLSELQKISH